MDSKLIHQAAEWASMAECQNSQFEVPQILKTWFIHSLPNLLSCAVATYLCFQAEAELNRLREEVKT